MLDYVGSSSDLNPSKILKLVMSAKQNLNVEQNLAKIYEGRK